MMVHSWQLLALRPRKQVADAVPTRSVPCFDSVRRASDTSTHRVIECQPRTTHTVRNVLEMVGPQLQLEPDRWSTPNGINDDGDRKQQVGQIVDGHTAHLLSICCCCVRPVLSDSYIPHRSDLCSIMVTVRGRQPPRGSVTTAQLRSTRASSDEEVTALSSRNWIHSFPSENSASLRPDSNLPRSTRDLVLHQLPSRVETETA